jgi:DNA-binding MarR family transcriptional regulator
MEPSPVDVMIERWKRERPDLDASSLQIIARVTRLARAIDEDAAAALREFNLSEVEFQLLAAIRTAPDCRAAPRTLLQPLMVTSGGLTNRIDRLEEAGWIVRAPNPDDRRGVFLELTPSGRELVDRVTAAYLRNQRELLREALTDGERTRLAPLLRKLLDSLSERNAKRRPVTGPAPEQPAT